MNTYNKPYKRNALEAKEYAQQIAFAPFMFQASVVMRDSGLLQSVSEHGEDGADVATLARDTHLSPYMVEVLLDFGLNLGLVWKNNDCYVLDKTGYFILNDEMTQVNMNFSRDVCYQALSHLGDSLHSGNPEGLVELGPWKTLYEGLSSLPEPARESWFRFDHFYSDRVFDECIPIIFSKPVTEVLDVGGNTGRWALRCLEHNPDVRVTIMDLPIQLAVADGNIKKAGFSDRFNQHPTNVLDESQEFYKDADVIWMSQFLDCFSLDEILSILKRTAAAMNGATRFYIIELFWDRQKYEAAAFSLNATSLYFSCVANGNSRMYHSENFISLLEKAGLWVEEDTDDIGEGHTLLCCRKA